MDGAYTQRPSAILLSLVYSSLRQLAMARERLLEMASRKVLLRAQMRPCGGESHLGRGEQVVLLGRLSRTFHRRAIDRKALAGQDHHDVMVIAVSQIDSLRRRTPTFLGHYDICGKRAERDGQPKVKLCTYVARYGI